MLNWEQREAGLPGQPPLPGLEDVPTQEERVFVNLARLWYLKFSVVPTSHAPPREVDELALSAALIAREHGRRFTKVAREQTDQNVALAERRPVAWMDRLPWGLISAAWAYVPKTGPAVEELIANLNHHNSALRIWVLEMAWIFREWLPKEKVLDPLLENVASTIAGVELSWGLAATLFCDQAEFQAKAAEWQSPNFEDQYVNRVDYLKSREVACFQESFLEVEKRCRHIIAESH